MTDNPYGINAIVYGEAKQGKSWFLDTMPAPRLILDAEGGSRFTPSRKIVWDPTKDAPPVHDGTWDTAIVFARTYRAVDQAFEWLNSGKHPFRSVGVDSISEVQQRAVDDIAGKNQMSKPDWGTLLRTISDLLRKFRDLTTHPVKPLDAVVFIAMAKNVDGVQRPYMQGQIGSTMPYYVDICAYLATIVKDDGGESRRLFIKPSPGFVIGERVGGCLGPFIDDPSIEGMLGTIRAFVTRNENTIKQN